MLRLRYSLNAPFIYSLTLPLQLLSIEDVERIMDETEEAVEYQKVTF